MLGVAACGCNGQTKLAAYLHKTEVAAEPPGTASPGAAPASRLAAPSAMSTSQPAASAAASPTQVAAPAHGDAANAQIGGREPPTASGSANTVLQPAEALPAGPRAVDTRPVASSTSVPPRVLPAPSVAGVVQGRKSGSRNASVGGAAVSGGSVRNAARVIAGFRTGMRDCFQRGRSDGEGAIRFRLSVGSAGIVTAVNAQPSGEVSADLVECTTARIRASKFDQPEGGNASIVFPVSFFVDRL